MTTPSHPTLEEARTLLEAATGLLERAITAGKTLTDGGKRIDDHQVATERIAYAATEAVAAHEVIIAAEELRTEGRSRPVLELTAVGAVGQLVKGLRSRLSDSADELGLGDAGPTPWA